MCHINSRYRMKMEIFWLKAICTGVNKLARAFFIIPFAQNTTYDSKKKLNTLMQTSTAVNVLESLLTATILLCCCWGCCCCCCCCALLVVVLCRWAVSLSVYSDWLSEVEDDEGPLRRPISWPAAWPPLAPPDVAPPVPIRPLGRPEAPPLFTTWPRPECPFRWRDPFEPLVCRGNEPK